MRRRLDLAASLVAQPSVLFLDEPTTGLDPRSRLVMWDVIGGLVDSGVTVFLTTQYLEEADRLADRVAVLDGGRVVAEGTPAELKRQTAEPAPRPRARRRGVLRGGRALARGPRDRRATRAPAASAWRPTAAPRTCARCSTRSIPAATAVERFSVHTATLDDVFLALTGHTTTRPEPETADV